MDKKGKKRKKAYYVQQSNKRNCLRLDAGMKGFLITCNNNEKRAVQESYNILNEYADKLYGPQQVDEKINSDVDDFEAEIRKEVDQCKSKGGSAVKRFQVVDTKTTNCVFIKTTVDRPDEVISLFLNDVYNSGVSKCRQILRIHPVLDTCRAVVDKIEKLAEDTLKPFFQPTPDNSDPLSYCIVYKVRCNNLGREDILAVIGRVVHGLNKDVKVNFDNPDYVISVDVLQKFCCLSVMKSYYKYRKYNVQELCKITQVPAVTSQNLQVTLTSDINFKKDDSAVCAVSSGIYDKSEIIETCKTEADTETSATVTLDTLTADPDRCIIGIDTESGQHQATADVV